MVRTVRVRLEPDGERSRSVVALVWTSGSRSAVDPRSRCERRDDIEFGSVMACIPIRGTEPTEARQALRLP